MQPICLGISLLSGAGCAAGIGGKRNLRLQLRLMLPLILLTALFNPLFNHQGVTILTRFPNGNPLTPRIHLVRPSRRGDAGGDDLLVSLPKRH